MYFVAVPAWLMSIWMLFQYMWMTLCFNFICQLNWIKFIINIFSFFICYSQLFWLMCRESKLIFNLFVFAFGFCSLWEKAVDNFNCIHFLPSLPVGRICFLWIDFSRTWLAKVWFTLWTMMKPKVFVVNGFVTFVARYTSTVIVTRACIKLLT